MTNQYSGSVGPAAVDLAPGDCLAVRRGARTALLVGYVAGTDPASLRRLLEDLLDGGGDGARPAYLDWDGNFTVLVWDEAELAVEIYRNFVSTCYTYYTVLDGTLLFANSLATLLKDGRVRPAVAADVLPLLFLGRFVPGTRTLVDGVSRLEPGERLAFGPQGLRVERLQTLRDLREAAVPAAEVVDRIEETMAAVLADIRAHAPDAVNLLSGGVDSSYIQAVWGKGAEGPVPSACAAVDHPMTREDLQYALEVSALLGTEHRVVDVDEPLSGLLQQGIRITGDVPNHVQSLYFGLLARRLHGSGVRAVLCGEGADSLFGTGLAPEYERAARWRRRLPVPALRRLASRLADRTGHPAFERTMSLADALGDPLHWRHPFNQAGAFPDRRTMQRCFSRTELESAFLYRQRHIAAMGSAPDVLAFAHNTALLCEGANTAATWTALSQHEGVRMYCPYLDSRFLKLALSLPDEVRFDRQVPKASLKRALERYLPETVVRRRKLGFGQPIFEWLAADGELRPLVDALDDHGLLPPDVAADLRRRPTWFLYVLLCYDLWHGEFSRA